MNAPEPWELFVLPAGVKKITYKKDGKIQNAATFTIEKEDHTLGNLLVQQLHRDPNVLFAGYKMPHPLEHRLVVKIQTRSHSDPQTALNTALSDLMSELALLEERASAEINDFTHKSQGASY